MKKICFVFTFILLCFQASMAEDLSIVDVRRNIPLADSDPVYRDYYINLGTASNLKKNLVVSVFRKINIKDSTGTQSYGDVQILVGQVKIIFANDKIAIAREYKLTSRDQEPMLEQTGILIGDKVETKGSFVDNKPPSATNVAEKKETVAPMVAIVAPVVVPTTPAVAPANPQPASITPTVASATVATAAAAPPNLEQATTITK